MKDILGGPKEFKVQKNAGMELRKAFEGITHVEQRCGPAFS